jgi:hypothetical protein
MMEGIRASERALERLPASVLERVETWDPARVARVIRPLFSSAHPIAGRSVYGPRRDEWIRLEDKTLIDELWDAVGVPRAPSEVHHIDSERLAAAADRLDQGLGTMWAADNRAGWHGGATGLRWVNTPSAHQAARASLADSADHVRVMPFVEGIPCSIHGIVFDDYVAALRPCEMIVLRRPGRMTLQYAAAATYWDPAPGDRAALRALARTVGEHLRTTVDYRGVFTIDGVMGRDGFVPTELNPRFGAAIGIMTNAIERLPMYLLHLAIVEREPLDFRPRELEDFIVQHADENRASRFGVVVPRTAEATEEGALVIAGGVREAGTDDVPDAHYRLGPAAAGTYVHVGLEPGRTVSGSSVAPLAASALGWLDRRFALGLGRLAPAVDVRRLAGS